MVQLNLIDKGGIQTETIPGKTTMKLNKMTWGLLEELISIQDELGSALDRIEGSGKADVIHAHSRLTDLSANVTLLLGQFNLKNLVKFIKGRTEWG